MNEKPKTHYELFQAISDRMMTATIFHSEVSELFNFMGLKGFKRMHEFQALEEDFTRDKIKRFCIDTHDKILKDLKVTIVPVVPDSWYDAKKSELTPQMRKDAMIKVFQMYLDWETESMKFYEKHMIELNKLEFVDDGMFIYNTVIKKVRKELKYLKRLIIELKGVEFNAVAVFEMQKELHDCYKKKIKKLRA